MMTSLLTRSPSLTLLAMNSGPGFLSNWQDALTLGSYLAFTVFIAWQIFTRSQPK